MVLLTGRLSWLGVSYDFCNWLITAARGVAGHKCALLNRFGETVLPRAVDAVRNLYTHFGRDSQVIE